MILSLHLFSVNWYICFLSYEIKHSLHAKMNGKFYIQSEHFRIRNSPQQKMFETGTKMSLIHFSSTLSPKFFSFSFLSSTNQLFPFSENFPLISSFLFYFRPNVFVLFVLCAPFFQSGQRRELAKRTVSQDKCQFSNVFLCHTNVFLSLVKCISKSSQMYF